METASTVVSSVNPVPGLPILSLNSGILSILLLHSSASEAPQISTISSIASAMGKYCRARRTPGWNHEPEGSRQSVEAWSGNHATREYDLAPRLMPAHRDRGLLRASRRWPKGDPAPAPADDRVVEAGIRQEADRPSASPRQHLLAGPLETQRREMLLDRLRNLAILVLAHEER